MVAHKVFDKANKATTSRFTSRFTRPVSPAQALPSSQTAELGQGRREDLFALIGTARAVVPEKATAGYVCA